MLGSKQLWHVVDKRSMRLSTDADMSRLVSSLDYHPQPLLFESLQGEESLSRLPEFSIRFLHTSSHLNYRELAGKQLTLNMDTAAKTRYLGGIVTQIEALGPADSQGSFYRYECQVRPRLWLSTLNKNYRIFQHLNVPEIVQEVLEAYELPFEFCLHHQSRYPQRDYIVQYGESDFEFISRLLEDVGIYYYFIYEENEQRLRLVDDVVCHEKITGYERLPYYEEYAVPQVAVECLTAFHVVERLLPTRYQAQDYNFLMPKASFNDVANEQPSKAHHPEAEVFEWTGVFKSLDDIKPYCQTQLNSLHHHRKYFQYQSTARGLATGARFQFINDPVAEYSKENGNNKRYPCDYLVTSTRYDLRESPYETLGTLVTKITTDVVDLANASDYRCLMYLTLHDMEQPYGVLKQTPRPRVNGLQSAVVVGPEGKEIWTNEHGQVKVQFHWDRYGDSDHNSSCWLRVVSPWASAGFGAIQVPRIGDEVLVDFINGDPDRPIIIGRAYNQLNMPPWELPLHATRSGFYTRSSPDGHFRTKNILYFEDKMDHEEVYLRAEKDKNTLVQNDQTHHIQNNAVEKVEHHKAIKVANNHYELIGGNMSLAIGERQNPGVDLSIPPMALAKQLGKPEQAFKEESGSLNLALENDKKETIGRDHVQRVMNNKTVYVEGQHFHQVNEELLIQSNTAIALQCGQSEIRLEPDGSIFINGKNLQIKVEDLLNMLSTIVKVN